MLLDVDEVRLETLRTSSVLATFSGIESIGVHLASSI